jgi:hypothetical protein
MSQGELLARLADLLDAGKVPYMVVGSLGSMYYSMPRSTNDIDIVINPTPAQLDAFVQLLPEDAYYVSRATATAALGQRSMFNIIDYKTGWKVDFIFRKNRPFDIEGFSRRRAVQIDGAEVVCISAEDSILSKLEWAKAGESDMQMRDVLSVVLVQSDVLNYAYLEKWAKELGVEDRLDAVLAEAREIQQTKKPS